MRKIGILISASLCLLTMASHASAQSLTVVGNNFEMYSEGTCTNSCKSVFPQNTSGRILKVTNVSCRINITSTGRLLYTSFGPAVEPNGSLLKEAYFDTQRTISNSDYPINYITATSGLMVGVNRYLVVVAQATTGQLQMRCAAAGVFAN